MDEKMTTKPKIKAKKRRERYNKQGEEKMKGTEYRGERKEDNTEKE